MTRPTLKFLVMLCSLCPVIASPQMFKARLSAEVSGNTWTYSITNEEPLGSQLHGGIFYVNLEPPPNIGVNTWISPVSFPSGWSYDTDYRSWICWFCTATAPASALVEPGETLGGFVFTCTPPLGVTPKRAMQPYYCQGSDPNSTTKGPFGLGVVLAPTYAPGGVVSGTINFDGISEDYELPIDVEFEFITEGNVASVTASPVHADGHFAIVAPQTPGSYQLSIKPLSMLRRTVSIDTSTEVTGLVLSLLNGDMDGDNEVSIGDFALLSSAYNSVIGDPNWQARADLNLDETVDIADYALVAANYGSAGD